MTVLPGIRQYGIRRENLRLREHDRDELAHYAKRTADIEYLFPMGWSELEGIANRTDFDLKQHAQFSGKALEYFDEETKQKDRALRHRTVSRRRSRDTCLSRGRLSGGGSQGARSASC